MQFLRGCIVIFMSSRLHTKLGGVLIVKLPIAMPSGLFHPTCTDISRSHPVPMPPPPLQRMMMVLLNLCIGKAGRRRRQRRQSTGKVRTRQPQRERRESAEELLPVHSLAARRWHGSTISPSLSLFSSFLTCSSSSLVLHRV